jgi:hypothetical protein
MTIRDNLLYNLYLLSSCGGLKKDVAFSTIEDVLMHDACIT